MSKGKAMTTTTPATTTAPLPLRAVAAADALAQEAQNDVELAGIFGDLLADPELVAASHAAKRKERADSTNQNYDYWISRLRRWLEQPDARFRHRDVARITDFDRQFWPIGAVAEELIAAWIFDEFLGPQRPADDDDSADADAMRETYDEWMSKGGAWAPATLVLIIAAIKARSGDHQPQKWKPSTALESRLTGLRRQLSETHEYRQATPLLSSHVAQISAHLAAIEPAGLALDRLIFEMVVARLKPGQIARATTNSVIASGRAPAQRSAVRPDGTVHTWEEMAKFSGRRLLIEGKPNCVPAGDLVLNLNEHPYLDSALHGWAQVRDVDGDLLVVAEGVKNPVNHVRASLTRTAELAEVEWRPKRGADLDDATITTVRTALSDRTQWSGTLINQRDQVALLVGFFAALRRSELVALRPRDIDFIDGDIAVIKIRKSKTDQESRGATVAIRDQTAGGPEAQVATLLRDWCEYVTLHAGDESPLFPTIDRHGAMSKKPLSGQGWSERLVLHARNAAVFGTNQAAQRKAEWVSGHSLRRGFVTTAALKGISAIEICKITRHKNVNTVAIYVDDVLSHHAEWTALLADSPALLDLAA